MPDDVVGLALVLQHRRVRDAVPRRVTDQPEVGRPDAADQCVIVGGERDLRVDRQRRVALLLEDVCEVVIPRS